MRIEIGKDWCVRMARHEGDASAFGSDTCPYLPKGHRRTTVTEQSGDDRQGDALDHALACVRMPLKSWRRTSFSPDPGPGMAEDRLRNRTAGPSGRKHTGRRAEKTVENLAGRRRQPDRAGARLAVAQMDVPVTEVRSAQGAGRWKPPGTAPPPVSPDPLQGLLPSGPRPSASDTLMMTDSTDIDQSADTGVACIDANQSRTSCELISAIWRPLNQGRIWLFTYHLFTFGVEGFQRRDWRRNASSATASKLVSSTEGTAGKPLRTAVRATLAGLARVRHAHQVRVADEFPGPLPPNCMWMKYRLRPDDRTLMPNPLRSASRTSRAFLCRL